MRFCKIQFCIIFEDVSNSYTTIKARLWEHARVLCESYLNWLNATVLQLSDNTTVEHAYTFIYIFSYLNRDITLWALNHESYQQILTFMILRDCFWDWNDWCCELFASFLSWNWWWWFMKFFTSRKTKEFWVRIFIWRLLFFITARSKSKKRVFIIIEKIVELTLLLRNKLTSTKAKRVWIFCCWISVILRIK